MLPLCRLGVRAAGLVLVLCLGVAASAAPLRPGDYTSLGTLNLSSTSPVTYTADTTGTADSNGNPTLTIGTNVYTGTIVVREGLPDVAVFTFDDVTIGDNVTIRGAGSRPLAILSNGDVTFTGSGSISVAAVGVTAGAGGGAPTAGTGGGPGGGRGGLVSGGGGGGFGGRGGSGGGAPTDLGGAAYGNLSQGLQAGSAGGFGFTAFPASGAMGGAGGGGLEIGAVGTVSLAATTVLDARGGAGANPRRGGDGGGGGSGGGLLLHAADVRLPAGGTLRASGGSGGGDSDTHNSGGGGGGGRVTVRADSYVTGAGLSVAAAPDVTGGAGGTRMSLASGSTGQAGGAGVARYEVGTTTVSSGTVFDFRGPAGFGDFATTNVTVQNGGVAAKVGAYANAGTVTVQSGGLMSVSGAASGGDWVLNNGTLITPGGLEVAGNPTDATLSGRGTVIGRVHGTSGAVGVIGGTMTLGDASRADAIDLGGTARLYVGLTDAAAPSHAILLDADRAVIGNTFLNGGSDLSAPNGIELGSGKLLQATAGGSTVDGVFFNGGTVSGPNGEGQSLAFLDDVSGAGNYTGNVEFRGGLSVGNSPAEVSFGSITLGPTADLLIEVGGLVTGVDFDALRIAGNAVLGGDLVVSMLNGFVPQAGQRFLFMDIAGLRTGTFAGLGEGDLVGTFGGTDLFVTYQAGNGNDVALFAQPAAVPEPSSLLLLGLTGGAAAWRRRRRAATPASPDATQ